jgi:hypothetical protein
MSEPFLERLSRFTPDAGRLERDALLFATGRGSARPNRAWITLASLLACTQALSLVVLWPHATPRDAGSPLQVANAPATPAVGEPATSDTSANPGLWSTRHSLMESESEDQPDTGTFVDNGSPLRAYGSPPSSFLN